MGIEIFAQSGVMFFQLIAVQFVTAYGLSIC